MYIDLAIEARAQDILTQKTIGPGFLNSLLQDIGYPGIFTADIDISAFASQGVAADDKTLY